MMTANMCCRRCVSAFKCCFRTSAFCQFQVKRHSHATLGKLWLKITESTLRRQSFSKHAVVQRKQKNLQTSDKVSRNEDIFFYKTLQDQYLGDIALHNCQHHETEFLSPKDNFEYLLRNLTFTSDLGWKDIKESIQLLSAEDSPKLIFKIQTLSFNPDDHLSKVQFDTIKNLVRFSTDHVHQWSLQTALSVASVWFDLRLNFKYSPVHEFMDKLYTKVADQRRSLTKEEVVQIMFYASVTRTIPVPCLNKVQSSLQELCDMLSCNDLSLICIGYFKTQSVLSSISVLNIMADRLKVDCDKLDSIEIAAFLKCFCKSTGRITARVHPSLTRRLLNVFDALSQRVDSLSTTAVSHATWCSFGLQQTTEQLLDATSQFVSSKSLNEWRLKDFSRLLFNLANFQFGFQSHKKEEFYSLFADELRKPERKREITQHPHCLLTALIGLSITGVFPDDLLDRLFQPKFLKILDTTPMDLSRDLIQLNETILLEYPQYAGCRLPDGFIKKKSSYPRIPNLQRKKPSEKEVMLKSLLKQLDPSISPTVKLLLPHFQVYDIEVQVQQRPTEVTPSIDKSLVSTLQKLTGNVSRIALMVHTANCFYGYRDSKGTMHNNLLGLHAMRKRQLQIKGYKVLQVTSEDLSNEVDFNQKIEEIVQDSNQMNGF